MTRDELKFRLLKNFGSSQFLWHICRNCCKLVSTHACSSRGDRDDALLALHLLASRARLLIQCRHE